MTIDANERARTGQPIDPVEILAALRAIPEVQDAVVTECEGADAGTVLVGYVTGPDPAAGTIPIRQHLARQLPDYLIPEYLFVLDELPFTAGGDYDLNALPRPEDQVAVADSFVAPRTELERQLAAAMGELLPVDQVGVHDNFFALGGSSFLATQLAARIREMCGVDVLLRDVFAGPTVDELASLVRTHLERTEAEERVYRRQRRREKAIRYVTGHPVLVWVARRVRGARGKRA